MQPGISDYAFDRRAATRARADAVQAKVVRVSGTVEAAGNGEGIADVAFSTQFVEVPTMSFGGQMGFGTVLVGGQFPTVSVLVHHFVTTELPQGLSSLVVGAALIIVTTGPANQLVVVHWQAEGKALSNPSDVGYFNSTGTA
jgi:hypothetical protein